MSEKEKGIGAWIQQPWHLALVIILIAAAIIRIYFFVQAGGQAMWWDEAEYMATAKHWAFDVPY
ncbi:hypothetical protein HYZ97_03475, partial [Candidatus Pacearchaeota archaeon]|nr:hypothetical protein [Candidatus Pacearchaeota archaeon]